MSEVGLHRMFNRAKLDDRQINELIGLARGIIADGIVNQAEAEYLFKWIVANASLTDNPMISLLYKRVDKVLADGKLESEEAADLLETLTRFSAGDFEIGEALKATTLPLCDPAPELRFTGSNFCLTGTFAYGSRRECENAIVERGGIPGSLTQKTTYLVIGAYATDSWAHSAYGRKIEKAVGMRSNGISISIVSENHWVEQMRQ